MNGHAVVALGFTRPVYVHELRPGDVFAFPDAPSTPLTVIGVEKTALFAELTLLALTVRGRDEPLHLPANTPVKALRMLRTVNLACLLCRKSQDIELDLPHDGEPLSLVCADHVPDLDELTETE
ncbi:hypothetical protein [Streptomyces sp. NBC_00286]|uniref:hypothetical protein n=1 Tax=Streptomyces sp. NBC_00286 TaxID=2975701 RepID=UPI002E2A9309|nr:hypothetical protein [Streptomyces sp. NBC_00286]